MSIQYTDGESIERRILTYVQEAKRRESNTAIAQDQYDEWAVRYHLSPERANLVRPFNWAGLDVLELGAGMGAVSRFLSENARSLHVVEGTEARFQVLSERLRDRSNWSGQVANIQDAEISRTFDVVCLIGVLEYSEIYVRGHEGRSPFEEVLYRCQQWLKPDGVVVIAIENQLGLKYWAGCAEDHRGTLFDGLTGYPDTPTARTFSRKELTQILVRGGFSHSRFFYPFPDYKIPTSMVSHELAFEHSEFAASLACFQPFEHYGKPPVRLFPTPLVAGTLAQAGLLAELSNSFLLFAAQDVQSPTLQQLTGHLDEGAKAWHFSLHRAIPTQTVFQSTPDGLTVQKSPLLSIPRTEISSAQFEWTCPGPSLVEKGPELRLSLLRSAYFQDWTGWQQRWMEFMYWSCEHWNNREGSLEGLALDAHFGNAARTSSAFSVFDLEWKSRTPIPRSWFVFRNILNLWRDREVFAGGPWATFLDLYRWTCSQLKVPDSLESDLALECAFQQVSSGRLVESSWHLERLKAVFLTPLGKHGLPRDVVVFSQMQSEWARLQAENADLHKRLGQLPHRLASVTLRLLSSVGKRIPAVATFFEQIAESVYQCAKHVGKRAKKILRSFQWQTFECSPSPTQDGTSPQLKFQLPAVLPKGFVVVQAFQRVGERFAFRDAVPLTLTVRFGTESATGSAHLSVPQAPLECLHGLCRLDIESHSASASVPTNGSPILLRLRTITRLEAAFRLLAPRLWDLGGNRAAWIATLRRGVAYTRALGWVGFKTWLAQEAKQNPLPVISRYSAWLEHYDKAEQNRPQILEDLRQMPQKPRISVIVPVFNTDAKWLKACIDSVFNQLYTHWELCIADDFSTAPHVREILESYRNKDPRVKVSFRPVNGHISAASNSALELATGEWIVLLDHDDVLTEDALYCVARTAELHPEAHLIYSDEDKIDQHGRRFDPHFKSDWNPDLFLSLNLVTHLSAFRRSTVSQVGGFRRGFEGSQDYDLSLRVWAACRPKSREIVHIPRILYHWRAIPGSVALAASEKNYAHTAARRAIQEFLETQSPGATVEAGFSSLHRVRYPLPPDATASLIVCTRDRVDLLRQCLSGMLRQDLGLPWELLIVDNQSSDQETLDYFRELKADPRIRILRYDAPFNFSAMNNWAVHNASNSFLVFLNNDLEVLQSDWLKEMVSLAARPGIGAVGCKLLYPNRTVQHVGIVTGIHGIADHVHRGVSERDSGYIGRAQVMQNMSAVSAACLAISRKRFLETGGFDEENLKVAYNDVDLCLKLLDLGYRNLLTPHVLFVHHESASRGPDTSAQELSRFKREAEWMKKRWGVRLAADRYYSPNLTLSSTDYSPAFPPRALPPWETPRPKETPRREASLAKSPRPPENDIAF